MMGRLNRDQQQLFYSFCLDEMVPDDHRVREIAAVLDLSWVHAELAPYYSPGAEVAVPIDPASALAHSFSWLSGIAGAESRGRHLDMHGWLANVPTLTRVELCGKWCWPTEIGEDDPCHRIQPAVRLRRT
jgi:hypothetical protein